MNSDNAHNFKVLKRARYVYLVSLLVTILAGLTIRQYSYVLPVWIHLYLGDFLWAIGVYLTFSILLVDTNTVTKVMLALVFSYSIEVSQLYHTPWLDQLRSNAIARLFLGSGFLWSDLVAYSLGVFSIAVPDLMLYASRRKINGGY